MARTGRPWYIATDRPSMERYQQLPGVSSFHAEVGKMMYWDGGWAWMAFMPLLWIVLIGLVVWAAVRIAHRETGGEESHRSGRSHRETPEEILDRRFASGEIDTESYTEARQQLATHRPRSR